MLSTFYLAKRTYLDIFKTAMFWVALVLTCFICFAMLFWGYREVVKYQRDYRPDYRYNYGGEEEYGYGPGGPGFDPTYFVSPETQIMYTTFNFTIAFTNLFGVFVMLGLMGKEIERKTIESLLARPISRGQIYFGKLIAGWAAIATFLLIVMLWSQLVMAISGMGMQGEYVTALSVGVLAPCLIGAITLFLSVWMKGFLAGLLGVIMASSAGSVGLMLIKIIGAELLKLDFVVTILYKILPPLNVIMKQATDKIRPAIWETMLREMDMPFIPSAADGLYSEPWHVAVYLAVVLVLGYLSVFRREFS